MRSIVRAAASLPPKPNAKPNAGQSATTNPVKSVCTEFGRNAELIQDRQDRCDPNRVFRDCPREIAGVSARRAPNSR